ncbi:MAG: hypothetical protein P9X24_13325 [Candidatus Hatepunaea meridiana]|nr:hypothetical protein [Candidatus Hatepunaea meridiana]
MSLSLQSVSRIGVRTETQIKDVILTCPECGQMSMIRIKDDCKLLDGTLIPNLERWQCSSCKADFFDVEAMRVIEDCLGIA